MLFVSVSFLQFLYSWGGTGNVFSWLHPDETIPRRSLANSLATYLHPPVWSSPMCLMVWLPSQRSQPQDRLETTGSIWKSKPHIYIYIHWYIHWYINLYIYIHIILYIFIYCIYPIICRIIHISFYISSIKCGWSACGYTIYVLMIWWYTIHYLQTYTITMTV